MKKIKSVVFMLLTLASLTCVAFDDSAKITTSGNEIEMVSDVVSPIVTIADASDNTLANAGWILVLALSLVPISQSRFMRFGFNAYFDPLQETPFTIAQKAVWDYLMQEGDVNTINALKKKELLIVGYAESLKFQVPISSANRLELLNATAVYRQGRLPQEFNQGFLPKGFNIAVSKIRAAFGSDAALLPEAIVNYTTIAAGWPAALQHGQFIISQNGAVKEQFSGRMAGSAAASFGAAVDSDGYELQSPMILEEGKPIKIELYCPQAVAFPATPAILAVAVELIGACIRPRS